MTTRKSPAAAATDEAASTAHPDAMAAARAADEEQRSALLQKAEAIAAENVILTIHRETIEGHLGELEHDLAALEAQRESLVRAVEAAKALRAIGAPASGDAARDLAALDESIAAARAQLPPIREALQTTQERAAALGEEEQELRRQAATPNHGLLARERAILLEEARRALETYLQAAERCIYWTRHAIAGDGTCGPITYADVSSGLTASTIYSQNAAEQWNASATRIAQEEFHYVASARLRVGDGYREAGDPVSEAREWPSSVRQAYLNTGRLHVRRSSPAPLAPA